MGIKDSARPRLAGLARHRPRFDRTTRTTGPGSGPGVRRLRRRREAGLAARPGRAVLPGRRLGRARRLPRPRARQLRAPLPHHLGHRARPSSRPSSAGCASASTRGRVELRFRHRVDALTVTDGAVDRGPRRGARARAGARGAPQLAHRGRRLRAARAGRRRHLRRHRRQPRPGPRQLAGPAGRAARSGCSPASPRTSTGGCSASPSEAGARLINRDRMWHYTEGIENWNPIWPGHGIRILPGPSSLWLDATGKRLPAAALPRLRHPRHARAHHARPATTHLVRAHPEDHREGVRALRLRAEPRPHRQEHPRGAPARRGRAHRARSRRSWSTARTSSSRDDLAPGRGMNELTGRAAARPRRRRARRSRRATARSTTRSPRTSRSSRSAAPARYRGDRLIRVARAAPDPRPEGRPADRRPAQLLTRKSLGGLETDLVRPGCLRRTRRHGSPLPGLYAAGEAAGFGGGGMHGYRSLEGTFLGGCLFTGRGGPGGGARHRRLSGPAARPSGRSSPGGSVVRRIAAAAAVDGLGAVLSPSPFPVPGRPAARPR